MLDANITAQTQTPNMPRFNLAQLTLLVHYSRLANRSSSSTPSPLSQTHVKSTNMQTCDLHSLSHNSAETYPKWSHLGPLITTALQKPH